MAETETVTYTTDGEPLNFDQYSKVAADKVLESILVKAVSLQDELIDYLKDPILNDGRFRFILSGVLDHLGKENITGHYH